MSYREFVRSKLPEQYCHSNSDMDLYHCVLGIVSEIGELKLAISNNDRPNIKEELGDALFYAQVELSKNVTDYIEVATTDEEDMDKIFKNLDYLLADLADFAKKRMCGRWIDQSTIEKHLEAVAGHLIILGGMYGFSLDELIATNRAKLDSRHVGHYTAESCSSRDVAKEREILEQDNFKQEG